MTTNNPFESDKPVRFLLGDTGIKVSNDPRANDEDWMEKALEKIENTGRATRSDDELHAELGTGGARSTMTGAQVQPPAMPVQVVGVNTPQGDAGEEDELLEKDESDMSVNELKDHVAELREAGVEVDTSGITKKSELVKAIKKAKKAANNSGQE